MTYDSPIAQVMMSMSEFGISPGNEKQRSLYEEVVMEFDKTMINK